jgi:hypothetical protein
VIFSFGKTYKHRCPDGSRKIVHRNVDDAFPFALKETEVKFATELDALAAGVQGQFGVEMRDKVAGLLFEFNEQNKSLIASFRAIYTGYQSDPCSHSDTYMRAMQSAVDEINRQTRFQMQIKALLALAQAEGADHGEIMRQFTRICGVSDGKLPEAASEAIGEARDDAHRWLQTGEEPEEGEDRSAEGEDKS